MLAIKAFGSSLSGRNLIVPFEVSGAAASACAASIVLRAISLPCSSLNRQAAQPTS